MALFIQIPLENTTMTKHAIDTQYRSNVSTGTCSVHSIHGTRQCKHASPVLITHGNSPENDRKFVTLNSVMHREVKGGGANQLIYPWNSSQGSWIQISDWANRGEQEPVEDNEKCTEESRETMYICRWSWNMHEHGEYSLAVIGKVSARELGLEA